MKTTNSLNLGGHSQDKLVEDFRAIAEMLVKKAKEKKASKA